jgi:hypothetical protein
MSRIVVVQLCDGAKDATRTTGDDKNYQSW